MALYKSNNISFLRQDDNGTLLIKITYYQKDIYSICSPKIGC